MIRPLIAALALVASTGTSAHNFWLQPENHTPDAGEDVLIEFKIGDAGAAANDWGLYWERIAAFRLHGPDGASDQQSAVRTTQAGVTGSAQLSVARPGSYVLAFESNPSRSDLEAERFNRYIENEGLTAIAAHRAATGSGDANGTELYARRAKTLLQVGDVITANVTRPIGQTLEIVPLQNPFALGEGDALDLQVFWRGSPLDGATLSIAPLDGTGGVETAMTSADGVVRVGAPGKTAMLYTVTWGVLAPNESRADYLTIFASLTVANPRSAEGTEAP
ncbi:DUF4198 domain-containing protein [uncultured Erythrobacter sp.]|uniref:DUF4198 domain-containing protein n=1 Tax=uncultured Erythrobacter sp. TaxID=263913 RepID=UPI00262D228E|nr:DUF4198 domain-containing protein [uncultured Erythrobacter sp.]